MPKIKEYIEKFKKTAVEVTHVDPSISKKIGAKPGITAAAFAKYIASLKMEKNFDDVFRPTVSEEIYRFLDRSFMGGYTVGNKDIHKVDLGDKNYGITVTDVNSMYPYIISNGIPTGRLTKKETPGFIEFVVICTPTLTLKEKYNFLSDLPIKQELIDGKPWLCEKDFYLDLQELVEEKITVKNRLWAKPCYQIATMVEDLYKKRKEKNLPKLTADTIKIILNSLYGKTCEKARDKHYILHNNSLEKVIEEHPDFRGILPGIYITNRARSILIKAIIQCVKDGNTFLYGDTDSVAFLEKNLCSFNIGTKLGQWKVEGRYNYFSRPLVRKKYLLEGINSDGVEGFKIAVSGFDTDIVSQHMTTEQRRLLFDKDVNVLWRRAKNHGKLNSLNQVIIDPIDVVTNDAIPITHELIFVNGKVELIKYDK